MENEKIEIDEFMVEPETGDGHRGSSHHHHHHGHRHGGKRKSGFARAVKKYRKILMPLTAVLLVAAVLLIVMLAVQLITDNRRPTTQQSAMGTDGVVVVGIPVFDQKVVIADDAAKAIVNDQDLTVPAHVVLQNYTADEYRLDICHAVKLDFYVANQPENYEIQDILVAVGEEPELQNPWQYTLEPYQKSLELFNLKSNCRYYYKITVRFTNSVEIWSGGTFETEEAPRILTIGGIRNVRDIGGWKTEDGKVIRQGLLYRGTELDGANDEFKLTEEGRKFLIEKLGICTDMDLRWSNEIPTGIHPLGDSVTHIYYGTPQYTDVFLDSGKETIRKIFSELADESNYPMYMHCIYGRDRTGTVCALLEALLGVSEDDIRRDYRLSALHNRYLDSAFEGFLSQLNVLEGKNIQEKTENYLLSIGVTQEEIAEIRTIFLSE